MAKFKLNNVRLASWGYNEPYNDSEYRYTKKLEKELKPYAENNCLKTDLESLSAVAKILESWNGQLVCINADKTITFFDGDY